MRKSVKVGVIGAGYWGEKLIDEYLELSSKKSNVKLCAVVDSNNERLSYVRDKYSLPSKMLYKSHGEVLNNKEVDAVHIATPNETHYQIALEATKRGKSILLEKPMTTSSRSAFKLAREAEKAGVVLLVGHIFRFNNAINEAKKIVEEGKLGEIYYLDLEWTTLMHKLPERDVILDLAPHPIDIINHLLEEWPVSVYSMAKSFKRHKSGFEEAAFINMDLSEGRMATVALSWIQPRTKTRRVMVVGGKSTLYIDALNQTILLCNNENEASYVKVKVNNTIHTMVSHFVDIVMNGGPPISSPLVGAMTVHIMEKIKESVEKGSRIEVMQGH